jgi:SNF2 family DNA or RNA helicase
VLSQTDYQTLDWINERNPRQYSHDPAKFSSYILLKLEEKYKVARNNHFPVHEIDVVPENIVMLSEISGSFLMITPQWNYDDIKVEGVFNETHQTHIQGELYRVKRHQQSENDFVAYLKNLHPSFAKQINGYFYLSFDEARKKHWFLKVFHQWMEENITIQGLDMLRHFRYSTFPIETELSILQQQGTLLHLSITVKFGKEEVSLSELKKLILAQQNAVLLKDDTLGVLTDEWVMRYGTLLKHGLVQKNIVIVPQWILLAISQENTPEALKFVISEDWRNQWTQWQQEDSKVFPLPKTLHATLRPYQQKGYEWMCLLADIGAGACLSDDMGLGKTLQTIAFILHRLEKNPEGKCIIACPASLMYNWQKEIEKFAPDIQTSLYYQSGRKLDNFLSSETQVLICSYGTLRSDIELLKLIMWEVAVLDESHNIKNQSSLISRAVTQLVAQSKAALSGTPIMNNTEDLYPQLNFLLPGYLGSSEFFRKEYAYPIDRSRDEKKMKALNRLTAPFILRRTKSQVAADLPEKIESVLWCEMNQFQKECYDNVKDNIRNSLFLGIKSEGFGKNKLSILQGIQKLRQICAAPQLVKDLEISCNESIKLDVIMDELNRLGSHKALVFSQFKGMLHLIASRLQQQGTFFYHFDGDTPIAQRQEMVSQFQEEDNDCRVFLISLMSGNAGLNLTAADYVFLVDPWWNTAVQQQAIDRTHRIGQDKNVFAYKMICRDSIEEKILQLQQRKQHLSENLIAEEEGFVKNLTEEDVAFLFS